MRRALVALALLFSAVSTQAEPRPMPNWIRLYIPIRPQLVPGGGGSFSGGAVTGATSFLDGANFQIKNTADPTKIIQVDLSGMTTGNTITAFSFSGTAATPKLSTTGQFIVNNSCGVINTNGDFACYSGAKIGYAGAALSFDDTPDTYFTYLGVGIFGTNLWVQQTGGYGALNANYTNATASFTNTALSRTLISGRTYSFTAALFLTQSTAADGVAIDFNGGSAAVTVFGATCTLTNAVGAPLTQTNATTNALATVINIGATTDTNQHVYDCSGFIVPSGAGTFIIRARVNTATTGTLTIKRGSWLQMNDVPAL